MKPLRDAMRREAGRVWREKARAAAHGLFLNEETITETLLLQLVSAARGGGFKVYPFTKAEETKVGADWEFWFIGGSAPVGLRVQAKRIFPSRRYDSLKPAGKQVHDLISLAAPCIPVFVFYNDMASFTLGSPDCGCAEYRGESYRGCIVAPAVQVQKAKSNDPAVLRHISMPWHCLLCDGTLGKPGSLATTVRQNLRRLAGPAAISTDAMEATDAKGAHELLEGRIAALAGRAREGIQQSPGWFDEHMAERKLGGIVLFSESDERPS